MEGIGWLGVGLVFLRGGGAAVCGAGFEGRETGRVGQVVGDGADGAWWRLRFPATAAAGGAIWAGLVDRDERCCLADKFGVVEVAGDLRLLKGEGGCGSRTCAARGGRGGRGGDACVADGGETGAQGGVCCGVADGGAGGGGACRGWCEGGVRGASGLAPVWTHLSAERVPRMRIFQVRVVCTNSWISLRTRGRGTPMAASVATKFPVSRPLWEMPRTTLAVCSQPARNSWVSSSWWLAALAACRAIRLRS